MGFSIYEVIMSKYMQHVVTCLHGYVKKLREVHECPKSHGLRSGERGGQATGSFLPTHWLGKWLIKHSVNGLAKCGGAPSCKYFIQTRSLRGTSTSSCSSNTLFKNSRYKITRRGKLAGPKLALFECGMDIRLAL